MPLTLCSRVPLRWRTLKNKEKFRPFPSSPIEFNKTLNSAEGHDYREKYGEFIERHGGLHNPGFSYNTIFDSSEHGWAKLLGIIKKTPTADNTQSIVKNMKAKKKIISSVLDNKNKELLLENENILKCFAYETFFKNKVQKGRLRAVRMNSKRGSSAKRPSRSDTSKMIMNLLGDEHFLKEVKRSTNCKSPNLGVKSEERIIPQEKVEPQEIPCLGNLSRPRIEDKPRIQPRPVIDHRPKFEKSVTMQTRLPGSSRKKDIKDSIKRCTIYTRESMLKKPTTHKFSLFTKMERNSAFSNLIRLNQISTIHKKSKESTGSFSSESDKNDTLEDEKEFDRHKTVLMPFGQPNIPNLSSKRHIEHEVILEDDENEEKRASSKTKLRTVKQIIKKRNFVVCKNFSSKKKDNLRSKIANKSNLIALRKNLSSSTKPSEVSRNTASYIKSVSPQPSRRKVFSTNDSKYFKGSGKRIGRINGNRKVRVFSMDKIQED